MKLLLEWEKENPIAKTKGNPAEISKRYYNVEVIDADGNTTEFYTEVVKAVANRVRNQRHKEGLLVNITEALSITRGGQEIRHFSIMPKANIPLGVQSTQKELGTPTYSERKFAELRSARMAKAVEKFMRKPQDGLTITSPAPEPFVVLKDLYVAATVKFGYKLYLQGRLVFQGPKVAAKDFMRANGYKPSELKIVYVGTEF